MASLVGEKATPAAQLRADQPKAGGARRGQRPQVRPRLDGSDLPAGRACNRPGSLNASEANFAGPSLAVRRAVVRRAPGRRARNGSSLCAFSSLVSLLSGRISGISPTFRSPCPASGCDGVDHEGEHEQERHRQPVEGCGGDPRRRNSVIEGHGHNSADGSQGERGNCRGKNQEDVPEALWCHRGNANSLPRPDGGGGTVPPEVAFVLHGRSALTRCAAGRASPDRAAAVAGDPELDASNEGRLPGCRTLHRLALLFRSLTCR